MTRKTPPTSSPALEIGYTTACVGSSALLVVLNGTEYEQLSVFPLVWMWLYCCLLYVAALMKSAPPTTKKVTAIRKIFNRIVILSMPLSAACVGHTFLAGALFLGFLIGVSVSGRKEQS